MLVTPVHNRIQHYNMYGQNVTAMVHSSSSSAKNHINFKGNRDLYYAINNSDCETVKNEIEAGTDVNYVYGQCISGGMWMYAPPLTHAVLLKKDDNKYKIIELLLSAPGINVNKTDSDGLGETALHSAVWNKDAKAVQMLLKKDDIDVNAQRYDGETALISASYMGYKDVVEELLKHPDIDITLKDKIGTAIDNANYKNHSEIADMIRKYKRGVDNRNPQTRTVKNNEPNFGPFNIERMEHMLTSTDDYVKNMALEDLLEYIHSDKFDPKRRDLMGRDVMQISLLSKDEKVKKVIASAISKGVDINSQNKSGVTLLMQSIKNFINSKNDDEKEILLSNIKFILNQNPNMDIQDNNGNTAFHYTCMSDSIGLMEMVLSKEPNVLLKDLKGRIGADFIKEPKIKKVYTKYLMR